MPIDLLRNPNVRRTDQNILILTGYVAVSGVLPYLNTDSDNNTYVLSVVALPWDLFSHDSLASIEGTPIVIEHPETQDGVTEDNIDQLEQGMVLSAFEEGDFLVIKVAIWGQEAIDYINNGNYELSAGYDADMISEDGYWYGTPYQYRKTNIRYNHVAIVAKGTARNGSLAKLQIDSNKARTTVFADSNLTSIEKFMPQKIQLNSKEFTVDTEVAQYITSLSDSNRDLQAKLETAKTQMVADSQAVNRVQELTQEVKQLKAQLNQFSDSLPKTISVYVKAKQFLGDNVDYKVPELDIMKQCLKTQESLFPGLDTLTDSATISYLFNNVLQAKTPEPELPKTTPVADSRKSTVGDLAKNTRPVVQTPELSSEDLAELIAKKRTQQGKN